jgi:hypothetical protein
MRIRSFTPVDFFRRSEHEAWRIESDHLELRVAFRATHDLTALDAVVDDNPRIAFRTHVAPPRWPPSRPA